MRDKEVSEDETEWVTFQRDWNTKECKKKRWKRRWNRNWWRCGELETQTNTEKKREKKLIKEAERKLLQMKDRKVNEDRSWWYMQECIQEKKNNKVQTGGKYKWLKHIERLCGGTETRDEMKRNEAKEDVIDKGDDVERLKQRENGGKLRRLKGNYWRCKIEK